MSPFNLDEYEPVEDRLRAFWKDHPMGRVTTELIHVGEDGYIVKASIWRGFEVKSERPGEVPPPGGTGYAQEAVTQRGVNATSALENCETSAIGRALANLGYAAKGKRPSREEMASATSSPVQGLQGVRRGGDGEADRATTADATGEGATSTVAPVEGEEAPASTPSAQPQGQHEHHWLPSPTLPGWQWCDVRGCGKARKAPKEAPVG